jgi:pimeloyl-ACP methyl ester carboxylesterase
MTSKEVIMWGRLKDAAIAGVTGAFVVAGLASAEDRFIVERGGDSSAQTVVFVPGLASSGETWRAAVDALGDTVDAHVITLAGFAGVPAVETGGSFVESAASAIADYIVAGDYTDVAVVGHSLGGQVALQVAARAPERVGGVVVVDSVPFYARLFNTLTTPEQAAANASGISAQFRAMTQEQYLAMMEQGLPVQSLDTGFHPVLMEWVAASDRGAVADAFAEVAGRDFSPVLDDVSAPVLVLTAWAPGSPMDSEAVQRLYAGQYAPLENASVEVIEGARHFLMIDQPDAFNARLARFLSERR